MVDRVNVEPPIVNGMSQSEAAFAATISFIVSFGIGLVVLAITGFWPLLMMISAVGTAGTVWVTSKHMATLKRNRPDGYHVQWLRQRLAKWGLRRSRLIRHDGHWQLGRGLH